jgi:hypothetical protein
MQWQGCNGSCIKSRRLGKYRVQRFPVVVPDIPGVRENGWESEVLLRPNPLRLEVRSARDAPLPGIPASVDEHEWRNLGVSKFSSLGDGVLPNEHQPAAWTRGGITYAVNLGRVDLGEQAVLETRQEFNTAGQRHDNSPSTLIVLLSILG